MNQVYQDMCSKKRERGEKKNIFRKNGLKLPKFDLKKKEKPLNSILTQKRIYTKRSTPKHRVLKLLTKKKLKAASKKQFIVHREKHHKKAADFSSETMEATECHV